jgi:hypothetical protein
MRTYEDFFKEQAASLAVGDSKTLFDADDKQLMVVVKVKRSEVETLRETVRANDAVLSSLFFLPNTKNAIGLSVTGSTEMLDTANEIKVRIPATGPSLEALNEIANSHRFLHFAAVSEDLKDVYAVSILQDSISKMDLNKKLTFLQTL